MKKAIIALFIGAVAVLSAADTVNLLKNGDFKSAGGWYLWQAGKKAEWPGVGSIGNGKIELKTCKNACYSQTIKVKPGEEYVFTVTGKNTSKGKASISLRFTDSKRVWLKEFKTAVLPADGKETTVAVSIKVPGNAATMSVQLAAANQSKTDNGKITFLKADLQKK